MEEDYQEDYQVVTQLNIDTVENTIRQQYEELNEKINNLYEKGDNWHQKSDEQQKELFESTKNCLSKCKVNEEWLKVIVSDLNTDIAALKEKLNMDYTTKEKLDEVIKCLKADDQLIEFRRQLDDYKNVLEGINVNFSTLNNNIPTDYAKKCVENDVDKLKTKLTAAIEDINVNFSTLNYNISTDYAKKSVENDVDELKTKMMAATKQTNENFDSCTKRLDQLKVKTKEIDEKNTEICNTINNLSNDYAKKSVETDVDELKTKLDSAIVNIKDNFYYRSVLNNNIFNNYAKKSVENDVDEFNIKLNQVTEKLNDYAKKSVETDVNELKTKLNDIQDKFDIEIFKLNQVTEKLDDHIESSTQTTNRILEKMETMTNILEKQKDFNNDVIHASHFETQMKKLVTAAEDAVKEYVHSEKFIDMFPNQFETVFNEEDIKKQVVPIIEEILASKKKETLKEEFKSELELAIAKRIEKTDQVNIENELDKHIKKEEKSPFLVELEAKIAQKYQDTKSKRSFLFKEILMTNDNLTLNIVKSFNELGIENWPNNIALAKAVRLELIDIIKYLAEIGTDVRIHNDSLLRDAAHTGNVEVLKLLIKLGLSDKNGALKAAVFSGQIDAVKYLYECGADLKCNDLLPFSTKHFNVLKFLIENGVDVHYYDDAAIKWASQHGYLDSVQYLINVGANIHVEDEEPLKLAIKYGKLDVVKLLYKNGARIKDDDDSITVVVQLGYTDIIEFLFENGVDMYKYKHHEWMLKHSNSNSVKFMEKLVALRNIFGDDIPLTFFKSKEFSTPCKNISFFES